MPDSVVTFNLAAHSAHVAHAPPAQDSAAQPLMMSENLMQLGNGAATTCLASRTLCARGIAASVLGFGGIMLLREGWSAWQHHHDVAPAHRPPARSTTSTEHPVSSAAPPRYRLDDGVLPPGIDASMLPGPMGFNASQLGTPDTACASLDGYVNGRWRDGLAMERSRSRQGTFDMLRDRSLLIRWQLAGQIADQPIPTAAEKVIGDLWASAMNADQLQAQALAPLQSELRTIDALNDGSAIGDHLAWLTAQGRNPLQDFSAHPDMQAPETYLGYLAQGELGLPDSAWYQDPAKAETVAAYRHYIARMLVLSGTDSISADHQAGHILDLETALAEHALPFSVLAGDDSVYYNPVDLNAAATAAPGLDWPGFVDAQGQARDTRFSLGMPAYHRRLGELMFERPASTWRAYLRFRALDRAAPCLHAPLVAEHEAFHGGVLKGRSSQVPRWAAVLDIIEQHAGEAFSESYVPVAFPPAGSAAIDTLQVNLRDQLQSRLAEAEWMTPSTRAHAQDKARLMQIDTGHPRHWPDWRGAGTDRSSFLHDVDAVRHFVHRRNIDRIGQPVERGAWKLNAQSVDAYHDPLQNRIVIPAALLQPPFFNPDADAALNYGGIGVVIAHEMAHGFDSSGAGIDGNGRLSEWWQAEDHVQFDHLRSRLVAQASGYSIDGSRVDGTLTIDENLADLGGLSIALAAMHAATAGTADPMVDGMTREQCFFANFAFCWRMHATPERAALDMALNDHAPPSVRADIGPSNLPSFARAFNCSTGAAMARPAHERVHFL